MPANKKSSPEKKKLPWNERNPVLYEIDGVPIRRVNIVSVYIPEHCMVKIAKALKGTNLSIAKILSLSSQPCDSCKHTPVITVDRGNTITIPRGLMFINKINSGFNVKNNKKRNEQNSR